MRPEERRTPGPVIPGVRRLVVVRQDRLGDFVLTLPAIAALRAAYPAAWLGVIVAAVAAPLARRVPGIDGVTEIEGAGRALSQALRRLAPELVVSISRSAGTALAAARAGVRHRIGAGLRLYSPLFTRRVSERRSRGARHEVEYALSFAHRAGAGGGPASFPLVPDADAERETASWLAARDLGSRFAVVHAGSGGSCPRWPVGHFLELAARLERDGLPTVATVGPGDDDVAAALDRRGIAPFRFRVENLAALTRRAALVVSNSTAPVHLAAAQGTPALALHAPWPSCGVGRWGPYHANGAGIVADAPGAASWNRAERRERAPSLLSAVPPDFVLEAIKSEYSKFL